MRKESNDCVGVVNQVRPGASFMVQFGIEERMEYQV